jgi:Na+/H+ antiporter NhaD/arsenite permease-like protein
VSLSVFAFLVLIAAFVWGSVTAVNAGLIAIVAAFAVGTLAAGLPVEEVVDQFPASLFFILAGATLLFAMVKATGTIDLLAHWAERLAGGRRPLIPVVMFLLTAVLATAGAFTPAAVAIVAPVALNLGARYGFSRLAMGLVIVQGANAGAFSPVNPFGVVANLMLREAGEPGGSLQLYVNCLVFNAVLGALAFVAVQSLLGRRHPRPAAGAGRGRPGDEDVAPGGDPTAADVRAGGGRAQTAAVGGVPSGVASVTTGRSVGTAEVSRTEAVRLTPVRALTLLALVGLLVLTLGFDVDVGVAALIVSLLLLAAKPSLQKPAIDAMPWSAILLVTGIVTYVGMLDAIGAIDDLQQAIEGLGSGSVAVLVTSYVVGLVSAFASTTGTLGAITPIVVPLAGDPALTAVAVVTAIGISSSVVDASPLSTTGALLLANAEGTEERAFFRALLLWAILMIAVVPALAWVVFVVLF